MTVVSDTGPILALAKTDGLSALFSLFPAVLTAPAVLARAIVGALNQRPDVWISASLCERTIAEIESD